MALEPASSPTSRTAPRVLAAFQAMRRWLQTFKFRVVLVAVFSALVAGVISTYYVARETEREVVRQLIRLQSDDVELLAALLHSKVQQTQRVLRLLSYDITSDTLESPSLMREFLVSKSGTAHFFDTIQIAGIDGSLAANESLNQSLKLGDISPGQRQAIERTLQARTGLVSPPMAGLKDESPELVFTMPLFTSNGTLFGVLAGGLKLHGQGLLPSSMDLIGALESALVVYDREGIVLFHSDAKYLLTHVGNLPGLDKLHKEWVESGANIIAEGTTRIYSDRIVSMAGMALPQWMVARVTPTRVALAPMEAVQRRSWLVTAGVMGVCAVLASVLILWMTRPITLLRNRASRMQGDDLAPEAGWPRATGEIGELTDALRNAAIERALQEATRQAMVRQLQAILTHAPVGIFMARNSQFELIGRQATSMLGYEGEELLGQSTTTIFGLDENFIDLQKRISRGLGEHGFFDTEMLLHRKDGTEFWAHVVGRSLNVQDEDFNHIWIFEDITLAREAQQELSWSATHDPLTHLANRREFEGRLLRALATVRPPVPARLSLMFIDLDYFKAVNDTAGHAAGDEVLVHVARVLEAQVRQTDTVGRLGGDEFAVLLPGCTAERAAVIAEKIRAAVHAWQPEFQGQGFQLGTSIGYVELNDSYADIAAALHAADTACYQAKRGGRNRVVAYSPTMAA